MRSDNTDDDSDDVSGGGLIGGMRVGKRQEWVFSTPVRSDNTDDDSDDVSGGGLRWHAGRKEARIGI